MKNTYVLMVELEQKETCEVGALGDVTFKPGIYGYVGSAKSSEFKRVSRHINVSREQRDVRHWHIDYLIGLDTANIQGAFTTTTGGECTVAQSILLKSVPEFGCSDCDCNSHLYYEKTSEQFTSTVRDGLDDSTVEFRWLAAEEFR